MLAVTFILLLIFMSGRFIKYLSQAALGNISPDILFLVMAYRLPGFLELILPLGLFMGVLLAYGRMYLESEMTVLHACGYSQNKLLGTTWLMAAVVAIAVAFLTLYVSPKGMAKVEQLFAEQASKTAFDLLAPGRFQNLNIGNRVTYAGSLSEDKKVMYDVFVAESVADSELTNILYAERGIQRVDEVSGSRFLILQNGRQYQGVPGQANYRELGFESYGVLIAEPDTEIHKVKEEAIPTMTLIAEDDLVSKSILYWRVSLVVLVPIVAMIAVSVCKVNPRQGRFMHLLPAMLLYILYLGLLILAKKKSSQGEVEPLLTFVSVHVAFFCTALVLFFKDRIKLIVNARNDRGLVK